MAGGAHTPQKIPLPPRPQPFRVSGDETVTPPPSERTNQRTARSSLPPPPPPPHRILSRALPESSPMDRLSRPASPGGGGLGYASRRGLYARPASPATGGSAQTSPGRSPKDSSPVHRHARAGSLGGVGAASTAGRRAGVGAGARAQNSAARAAAQRLARVMGGGAGGDGGSGSDDDDDYELSGPPIELSATPRRTSTRSPSPSVIAAPP